MVYITLLYDVHARIKYIYLWDTLLKKHHSTYIVGLSEFYKFNLKIDRPFLNKIDSNKYNKILKICKK